METTIRFLCYKKSMISVAHNLVQHDQMKPAKVDRHLIKEKLDSYLKFSL